MSPRADFLNCLRRRILYAINSQDILTETQETYNFLHSIGIPCSKLPTGPGKFAFDQDVVFTYNSVIESDDRVTFYDVTAVNDLYLCNVPVGHYSQVYYLKNNMLSLVFLDDDSQTVGTEEYEPEYIEVFKRGNINNIHAAICRIMQTDEYDFTVEKMWKAGNYELAASMHHDFGMYAPKNIKEAIQMH